MTLLKGTLVAFPVLLASAFGGGYAWLRASLPVLEGEVTVASLTALVRVERDSLGVPTITAASRVDVARALGFVHAQERFFQMDLLRRTGAGELSALFGPQALGMDSVLRMHRFRARSAVVLERMPSADRMVVRAYTEGVNAGLDTLGARPFEYVALREAPVPWREADVLLAAYAMFMDLHLNLGIGDELETEAVREGLPPALAAFLRPLGDEWDAPLAGDSIPPPPIPAPDELGGLGPAGVPPETAPGRPPVGSNNFAVAGAMTGHGGAVVANDMHLGLRLPHVWFRASLVYPGPDGRPRRITGVTLPGVPAIVVGSNGHVAWGFTNSYGDYIDRVRLVPDSTRPGFIRTDSASVRLDTLLETIEVKGGEAVRLPVVESPWGPVTGMDADGYPVAFQWTAHHPDGLNLRLMDLEGATSVSEALAVAKRAGIPPQNFVVGARDGHIAWTIIGQIPRRTGHDGTVPTASTDPSPGWQGFLAPDEAPQIVDPSDGRIWTANNRVVEGEALQKIGLGPYAHGVRAWIIRDRLRRLQAPVAERDLLTIQLDHRADFLARWHGLLVSLLNDEAVAERPDRAQVRAHLARWEGAAVPSSVSYRIVRAWRAAVADRAFGYLYAPIASRLAEPPTTYEGPLWRMASERPAHLLDSRFDSWEALLLDALDEVVAQAGGDLGGFTWGAANTARIAHPLADVLPIGSGSLRMPAEPLAGDIYTPNATGPDHGPSERMVVAPGHEETGIMQMPGGQAGHPLSPYWGAGHDAWVQGRPTPFLPGRTVWTLVLRPA